MLKALYAVLTFAFGLCLLQSFERRALAYVDPGSGLFVLQSISSIGVGVLFFLRRRIRALFRRGAPQDTAPAKPAVRSTGSASPEYQREKAA